MIIIFIITILMMIKAGPAVDETLGVLLPLLATGDILIDGGNTHFRETQERRERCAQHGVGYVGLGVSGGPRGLSRICVVLLQRRAADALAPGVRRSILAADGAAMDV